MKKGAVAGAIVWSAPLLTSTPAFAASAKCSGSKVCRTFYYCKIDSNRAEVGGTSDGSGCGAHTLAQLKCAETPIEDVSFGTDGCSFVSGTHNGANTAQWVYDAGVVPLVIQVKYGNNCQDFTFNDGTGQFTPDPFVVGNPATCTIDLTVSGTIATGLTVDIVKTGSGNTCPGISHIGTYFCK